MDRWPYRLVTFDLDGTLTQGHGWAMIADAAGRTAEYQRTNRRFLAHQVGEDEHLEELLELAAGLSVERLHQLLAATPKVSGIREAIVQIHERGGAAALLTHNPSYVYDWYATTFGFDDGEGTPGPQVAEGVIGRPGPVHADKAAGLARLLQRHAVHAREVAHVGDGWADARVFPLVGAGVAFNSQYPEVNQAADAVVTGRDLRDVVRVLDELPPRSI